MFLRICRSQFRALSNQVQFKQTIFYCIFYCISSVSFSVNWLPGFSFIFKMAAMFKIPRVFPRVFCLDRKCTSGPIPPSRAKHWLQKSANPALFPRMSPGSTPGMAADKCIRHTKCLARCKNL